MKLKVYGLDYDNSLAATTRIAQAEYAEIYGAWLEETSAGLPVLQIMPRLGPDGLTYVKDGTIWELGLKIGAGLAYDGSGNLYATQSGLDVHTAARVATTANITTLAGGAPNTLDGVTLATNDRVLVKNQSTGAQNGIYYVSTLGTGSNGTWTRATDADTTGEIIEGTFIFVTEGTTQANTGWTVTTTGTITIGTTAIVFAQFSGGESITAGAGLTKTGTTIDIIGTTNRILVNADSIDISSAYVGQTSITTLGTVGTGIWQGTIVGPTYGGTGVNNGSNTVTLAGNLVTAGAFALTLTTTATTNATLPAGSTTLVPTSGTGATGTWGISISGSAATLTTTRSIWGQNFNGSADVTGALSAVTSIAFTGAATITGGAGNMTVVAGTGASRSLIFQTTTAGSTATTALTLTSTQTATFAGAVTVSAGGVAVTGNSTITGTLTALTGITSSGTAALATVTASALITANGGLTVTSGQTLTVTGATITGLTAASVGVGTFPGGTYGFTGATTLTGGAGNMTIVAGTGASRTLVFQTTTAGSAATTALTLSATQTATFAGAVTVSTGGIAVTGNSTIVGTLLSLTGITSSGTASFDTVNASALVTANAGLTITSGQTLTVTGVTVTGLTAGSVGAGTFPGGAYNFTGATTLTGGAGDMTIVSGTGASRAMVFQTTTGGGTATTALTLSATQTATFAGAVTVSAGGIAVTGNSTITGTLSGITTLTATTFSGALSGNATTATTLQTSRNLWGQAFNGSADVTGSLTSVTDITGGASSMVVTAGTGNSRTLTFRTTTSAGAATTALVLSDTQGAAITGVLSVTDRTNVYAAGTTLLNLRNSTATADAREWSFRIDAAGVLDLRSVADANTTQFTAMSIARSGAVSLPVTLGVTGLSTLTGGATAPAPYTATSSSGGFVVNTTLGTLGVQWQDAGVNRISMRLDSSSLWSMGARTTGGVGIDSPFSLDPNANGDVKLGGAGRSVQINTAASAFAPVAGLYVRGSYNPSSATARAMRLDSTLIATANADTLLAMDLAPVITPGAFTGLNFYTVRVANGSTAMTGNKIGIYVGTQTGATGNNFGIQSDGTIHVGGTFTPSSGGVVIGATITASSGAARGFYSAPTLTAAANSDSLAGMQITPGFSVGGFTGTNAYGLLISNITGAANNYAIATSAGTVQFGGTFTPSLQTGVRIVQTLTASSALVRGVYMNSVLVAAANGDSLYGLQVQPSLTIGGFTGTTAFGVAINDITGAATNYSLWTGSGLVRLGGQLSVVATQTQFGIQNSASIVGSGGNSIALYMNTTLTAGGNSESQSSIRLSPVYAAGGFTGLSAYGLWIQQMSGLTSAHSNGFGVYVASVSGATNNYAIYTNAGTVRFGGDTIIGSLGTFDSATAPSTGMFMAYNLSNDSKWKGVNVQLAYASSDTIVSLGADSTAYSYVYESGRAGTSGTPAAPLTVTATAGHLSVTLDWSTSPFTSQIIYYEVQYDDNNGFSSPITVLTTSRKFVHSRLTNAAVYYYRVRAVGVGPLYSGYTTSTPTSITASKTSDTSAFGSIIAAEIAVADLSAINANLGRITGTGIIQNNSSDSATRTGIRFSSGYTLPSGWYGNPTTAFYMDLAATGGANDSKYLSLGSALRVYTDGSATFSGAITGTSVTASAGLFVGSGTLVSDQAILNVPTGTRSLLVQSTGTLTDALVRDPAVRGVAVKADNIEVYDRVYDGTATSGTAGPPGTITDTGAAWALNQWAGARDSQPCEIKIVSGTGSGATWYSIASNTATAITIVGAWASGTPASGSVYQIRGIIDGVWGTYTATVGGTLVAYLDDTNYSGGDQGVGTWDDSPSSAQRTSFTVGTTTASGRNNRLEAASSLPANGNQYTVRYKHRCNASGVTCNTGSMKILGRTKVQYSTDTGATPPTAGWTDLATKLSIITIPAGEVGFDTGTTEYTDTFTITGVTSTLWIRVISETEYAQTFTASGTGATTEGTGVHVSYSKTTSGKTVTRRNLRLWPTANLHNDAAVSYSPNFTLEPLSATPSTTLAIRGDVIFVDGGSPSTTLPYFFDGTNWQSMKSATPGTHGREAHTVNLVPTNGSLTTEGDLTYNTTSDRFEYHDGTTTRSLFRREGDTMTGALTYGGVTLSNSVTGTGSMVLSASPTFTGTALAAAVTLSGLLTISKTGASIVSNDNVSGSDAVTSTYISFQRGGVEKGWVGFGDASSGLMRLHNGIGELRLNATSGVTLYYNGSLRLSTVSGGIDIANGAVNLQDNIVQRPVLKDYGETASVVTYGATPTFDITTGNIFRMTLTGSITSMTISNPSASGTACTITFMFTQDATGGRTVGWPASVKWGTSGAPALSGANKLDLITMTTVDGGTTWYGTYALNF